jgi:branched-chain amino acid transport system ATP-binding protein
VLDQGRNAYSGTGADLLDDDKVVQLYLGTLARAGTRGTAPGPSNA